MSKIIITSDSTADLSEELIEKNGIVISPLHVYLGEEGFSDGVDITPQNIFDYVAKTDVLPKTSAYTIEEYTEFFSARLKEGDFVIHFNISGELSSTASNAALAAEKFGGKVRSIDTRQLSTGQGLLALKACDMRDAGEDFESIVSGIEKIKESVQTSFVVDTVDYLYKGGRCTGAARFASKVLKIHPSIKMEDGKLSVKKKYVGTLKRSIGQYVDDLASEFENYDDSRVFITHSCCSEEIVDYINEKVKEKFSFREVITTVAGSVITSHCGQGTLGVLFIRK